MLYLNGLMETRCAQDRKEIPFLGVGVSLWQTAISRVVRAWGLRNLGTILEVASCGMHHVGTGIGVSLRCVSLPDVPLLASVWPGGVGDTISS